MEVSEIEGSWNIACPYQSGAQAEDWEADEGWFRFLPVSVDEVLGTTYLAPLTDDASTTSPSLLHLQRGGTRTL